MGKKNLVLLKHIKLRQFKLYLLDHGTRSNVAASHGRIKSLCLSALHT